MWRKWLKSVLMSGQRTVGMYCLHSSSVHIPLLGTQSLMSSLQFFTHFSQSLLVFPAFCYPFATIHFKVPILCLLLSFSLFSVVPSQTMKESLGCAGGGGGGGSESLPVTDSPVWDWLLGLCPFAKENGGNPERRSSEGSSVKEGGSEGPFMCRSFGNFGFQTEGSAIRGVSLAKRQNKISSYCFMVHVPLD